MPKILYIPSGTYLEYNGWEEEVLISVLMKAAQVLSADLYNSYKEKHGIPINIELSRSEFEIIYD